MTCVVAWTNGTNAVIGADSCVVLDGVHVETSISKIVKLPYQDLTIGVAGCVLASQLLRYEFKVPRQLVHQTDSDWVNGKLAPEIRRLFKQAEVPDCALLIVFGHELYLLSGLLEVVQRRSVLLPQSVQFDAIGSGSRAALGASWAYSQFEDRLLTQVSWLRRGVEISLGAAGQFDRHVCTPFVIEEV